MLDRLIDRYRLPVRLAVWLAFLAAASLYGVVASAAPTVSLTASPASGVSPLDVTLSWSSADAVRCTAGGAWQGDKALTGSEVVTVIAASTFTLTCSAADGSAQITWVAPTRNTDGSTIPAAGPGSLAGFKIYHGEAPEDVTSPAAAGIDVPDKAATTYTITALPAGPRHYAATAYNVEAVESDKSGLATNVVEIPATSATAAVTVSTKPMPPTIVAVETLVYEVRAHPVEGTRLGRLIGTVPLGTKCDAEPVVMTMSGTFHAVDLRDVVLAIDEWKIKSAVVVAKCGVTG